jgi:hypothetical protein
MPLNADGEQMVGALVRQAREVFESTSQATD